MGGLFAGVTATRPVLRRLGRAHAGHAHTRHVHTGHAAHGGGRLPGVQGIGLRNLEHLVSHGL